MQEKELKTHLVVEFYVAFFPAPAVAALFAGSRQMEANDGKIL